MNSITPNSSPSVAIETHGCKLNQSDSTSLAWEFLRAGYKVVTTDDPADVYILNSCTVTHVADRKARHALRAARRRNPGATIVATGCYAQQSPDTLDGMADVDIVAGNTDKATLVEHVTNWRGETFVPCAEGMDADVFDAKALRTRAMVKIQEGCDQVCSYCIVPKVRGRERSVPVEMLVRQINQYVDRGYKEVVLTGTQLGSYGFDLQDMTLTKLVKRVLDDTSVQRLRVSSLQPQEITREFLKLWEDDRLCPHFHMPLQSGNNAVLDRMRRRYTGSEYAERVRLIRSMVPGASVTADVIVGFPGESDSDFEDTFSLCSELQFAGTHAFPYSIRPGTSAAHFDDQVSHEVKAERLQRLIALADTSTRNFEQSFDGESRSVLWEDRRQVNGETRWVGLTDNYIRVAASHVGDLANKITRAVLIRSSDRGMLAEVVVE